MEVDIEIWRLVEMDVWGDQDEFFSVSNSKRDNEDALRWATIEKFTTYKRMRTSLLKTGAGGDDADLDDGESMEVDVRKLNAAERQEFITSNFKIIEDDTRGPSSSGKTALLLALTGKLDPSLEVCVEISYNGHRLNEFVPWKMSVYISQKDMHLGEQTVRETLDYSARYQGVGPRYDLLTELTRREKDAQIRPDSEIDLLMKAATMEGAKASLITDYTLKLLGLDICKDTAIGDEMKRGISRGQKKRVTTGEMMVAPTKMLLLDEISTGLNSLTTFQIIKCMQQIVHVTDVAVLMSHLHPDSEIFELFDDIILLSERHIVYQGPRGRILEFFESCDFRCPERKDIADFLQEVTSQKDQQQYWADNHRHYL